jgi:hypothetical protein
MSTGKDIVVTAYGHDRSIDKFAVSFFDRAANNNEPGNDSNAQIYCDTINKLELNGNRWVLAKIVPGNTPCAWESFIPLTFNIIAELDDRAVMKIMRELDSQELAKALKGAEEAVKEKIFRNMSKKAAEMLKEDMDYMGPIKKEDAVKCREKIADVIRRLEQAGEIVITYPGEEKVV